MDIEQAKQEIAKALPSDDTSSKERLRLLLLHSKNFYRNAPKDAEKWAREALTLAKKLKDKEAIARAHYLIGIAKYQRSDYANAEKEFRIAMELDEITFEEPLLERPIFSLGLTLMKTGRFRDGIELYEQALKISRTRQRKSEIDILGALGNAALEQGDYPKALEYQYASLAILDRQDDPLRRSVVLSNIGRIYLDVEDLNKAELFFDRSYYIKININDSHGLAIVTYNRGVVAYKLGNYSASRKRYDEALQITISLKRTELQAYIEDALGSLDLQEGKTLRAISHFDNAIVIGRRSNFNFIICAALVGKAKSLLQSRRTIEVIQILQEAHIISQKSKFLPLQCECVSALAKAYEAAGNLKESLRYYNRFIELNAEVHNEQKQRALVEISARVEIEKADRERERLAQLARTAEERAELLHTETERQSRELTSLALQLLERNEFLSSLREEIGRSVASSKKARAMTERIDAHIKSDRDWETFEHQFDAVHRNFLQTLAAAFPTLTPMEMRVAVLMKLELSTKEIATLLCLSKRTVENHRLALRRKLRLGNSDHLVAALTALGGA